MFRLLSASHIAVYRLSGGRVLGHVGPLGVLLLTTTGRRSGKRRTVPLLYCETGSGFGLIASKGGAPRNPGWCENLFANPDAAVEIRGRRIAVRARRVEGDERAQVWSAMVAGYPGYDGYQRRTEREIPVFLLEPPRALDASQRRS
jgi:deazaflavin-dependent oxidoreductase (nitroreductase family)